MLELLKGEKMGDIIKETVENISAEEKKDKHETTIKENDPCIGCFGAANNDCRYCTRKKN